MMTLKYVYIGLVILYIGIIALWCMRYPLSYRIVGVKPNLIEERSLTHQEYKAQKKAVRIRQWCSQILFYASIVVLITSFLFLRNSWFAPIAIVKIVLVVSGIITFILMIVDKINFIPGPPIR
jgi:hypothetical protein